MNTRLEKIEVKNMDPLTSRTLIMASPVNQCFSGFGKAFNVFGVSGNRIKSSILRARDVTTRNIQSVTIWDRTEGNGYFALRMKDSSLKRVEGTGSKSGAVVTDWQNLVFVSGDAVGHDKVSVQLNLKGNISTRATRYHTLTTVRGN